MTAVGTSRCSLGRTGVGLTGAGLTSVGLTGAGLTSVGLTGARLIGAGPSEDFSMVGDTESVGGSVGCDNVVRPDCSWLRRRSGDVLSAILDRAE